MIVKCPHCGSDFDAEKKDMFRYVKCTRCGRGFVAGATGSLRREDAVPAAVATDMAEERLRLTINPKSPPSPRPAPYRNVAAVEERVRMYDEMKRKNARQKMLRNLVESGILLLCLVTVIGCCLWWRSHANRVEEERIRLKKEYDRIEAENLEKKRLRQEEERAREDERTRKILEERKRRMQEEREARENAEKVVRTNMERYGFYLLAIKENSFDLFVKSVTNDMERTGGELCYLLPSASARLPLYRVSYETNAQKRVCRLYEDGQLDEIGYDGFQELIRDKEYLVAKGGKVHFKSMRKNPSVGVLSMSEESDPADAFFGTLAGTLKKVAPVYDELTFDIFFTPRGSSKSIFVENLPFGGQWSLHNVRESVEKATPMERTYTFEEMSRPEKFKRTVKIYNGGMIKRGIDGITYVPRHQPRIRLKTRYTPTLPNVIYRSRTLDYSDDYTSWQSLYDAALREDAEEKAYYERWYRRREESRNARRAAGKARDEDRWAKKIDGIVSGGTLSYKIRKAIPVK